MRHEHDTQRVQKGLSTWQVGLHTAVELAVTHPCGGDAPLEQLLQTAAANVAASKPLPATTFETGL